MRDLTVTEAAAMIGVSRARVYQRITGQAGTWAAGKPLPAILVRSTSRGSKNGRQMRVAFDLAMQWRQERLAAGLAVGPVPAMETGDDIPAPPAKPSRVTEEPAIPIGMPTVSPF